MTFMHVYIKDLSETYTIYKHRTEVGHQQKADTPVMTHTRT